MVYQNRQVVLSNSCRFLATHGKEMLATHLRKLNCLVTQIEGFAKLAHARHISKREQAGVEVAQGGDHRTRLYVSLSRKAFLG
jgi:hypothetical protein